MPILIKALIEGFDDEQILQSWTSITPQILAADNLEAKAVSTKLDHLRDEWIQTDLNGWLSLHRFYPGVIERLKITL